MLNIISYTIYFLVGLPVVVLVGYHCFSAGRVYLLDLFHDIKICDAINRVLLIGYYLLNIGYLAVSLSNWGHVENLLQLVRITIEKLSIIFLLISVLHYLNLFTLYFARKKILSTFKS